MTPSLSPVVGPDGTLSLALRAPAADSVKAVFHAGDTLAMARDGDGVWRVDAGPLEPGFYFYTFQVDGMLTNDPTNPDQHPSLAANVYSWVIVPADPPAFYEEQDVPRGVVHHHRHRSRLLGDQRGYLVYTPPGYADAQRRYPVLYLLHGYSGSEVNWSVSGRLNIILDNLIATGVAEPMIAVMPRGYVSKQESLGDSTWAAWGARVTPRVSRYIVDELVPRIDAEYRTRNAAGQRAIAGVSMGGLQSLFIGLRHPERFAWVGAFSAAVMPPAQERLLEVAPDATRKLLWIGCGRQDFLYQANARFIENLQQRGIAHVAHVTAGGHSYVLWQGYLRAFAGLLFREPAGQP